MTHAGTIAIDFDGVLHSYQSGWQGVAPTEPPTPGAREACAALRAAGYRLVVHTCRALTHEGLAAVLLWLAAHGIEADQVTAIKPHALLYVDDRAWRFEGPDDWLVLASRARAGALPRPWCAPPGPPAPWSSDAWPHCGACGVRVSEVDARGRYRECGHLSPAGEELE